GSRRQEPDGDAPRQGGTERDRGDEPPRRVSLRAEHDRGARPSSGFARGDGGLRRAPRTSLRGHLTAAIADPRTLFRTMLTIREAELALARLFADGEVPGFIHLSVGQEAVAAGVCAALGPEDSLASTHRGHGHA